MRALLLALLVGCTPPGITTSAEHPANPKAPTGRLAGPPPALRPGVADVSTPTPPVTSPPAEHAGHQQPAPEQAPAAEAPAKPQVPPKPKQPAPKKPAPKPEKPAPAPEHQGHEGHH